MTAGRIFERLKALPRAARMPALFVGHGSPMNAILDNDYSRTWKALGETLPRPQAILSISAHWVTPGTTKVSVAEKPETIHDFVGFPEALFRQEYAAPGAPTWADETVSLSRSARIQPDASWGLDHGTWSVLLPMYPRADVPAYQLSLDYAKNPQFHFELGAELRQLRDRGVLILGSGNIVHNLGAIGGRDPYDWSLEFDERMKQFIDSGDFQSVVRFRSLGTLADLAHPTHEHFLPLLYTLAVKHEDEDIQYFTESIDMASVSMRSLIIS